MPVDYAAALLGGQAVVPDYNEVAAARQQRIVNQQLIAARRQQMEHAAVDAQRNLEREAAWGQAIEEVAANPNPEAVARMMLRFPERREVITGAFDRMGQTRRTAEVRQLGAIYSMLNADDYAGAAGVMRQRIEADTAAGQDTTDDQEILTSLESDDPAVRGRAAAMIGATLAALEPDNFTEAYARLNPRQDPTNTERVADLLGRDLGPEAREQYLRGVADEIVTVPLPGGRTYVGPRSGLAGLVQSNTGGGDPQPAASGDSDFDRMVEITMHQGEGTGGQDFYRDGRPIVSPRGATGRMQVMPGTNTDPGFGVTAARDNSPEERARVGRDYLAAMLQRYGGDRVRAWAAYNAGPGAVDAAIARGGDWLSRLPRETRDYVGRVTRAYSRGARPNSGVVRVRSREQYDALPAGTRYVAPDGTVRTKQ